MHRCYGGKSEVLAGTLKTFVHIRVLDISVRSTPYAVYLLLLNLINTLKFFSLVIH